MCARYYIDEDSPEFGEMVEELNYSPLTERFQETAPVRTSGEIRPMDVVPVIAPDRHGKRAVFPMQWGYRLDAGRPRGSAEGIPVQDGDQSRGNIDAKPRKSQLLINARTESAAVKPTFMEDWERHRCIVPASWYFEWEHRRDSSGRIRTGSKYAIRPAGEPLTLLCGLYRIKNGLPHFVILTREPGEKIRFIHDRMPLILPRTQMEEWIRPDARPEELLSCALTDMTFHSVLPQDLREKCGKTGTSAG